MNEENEKLKSQQEKRKQLNEQLKHYLLYSGFASAGISALAYIVITFVMVFGIKTDMEMQRQIVFSILGAATGLIISFLLRSQGIAFAKSEDTSKDVMKEYYEALNKTKTEKELHKISYHLFWWTIKDFVIKGVSVAISSYFVLYTFVEASKNWALLGLAVSNIFMFIGFGLMALSKAYDKYIDEHIPVIKELTKKLKKDDTLHVTKEDGAVVIKKESE